MRKEFIKFIIGWMVFIGFIAGFTLRMLEIWS